MSAREYKNPNSIHRSGVMMFSDIYVTVADLEEAKRIGRTLTEEKLCACVNIHPIESIYWWQGSIEEDREYAVSVKTKTALTQQITSRILELHSYENPCIISFNIDGGSQKYLEWIAEETI